MKLTTARLWRRGAITAIAGASALALTACGGGGGSTAGTDSLSLFVNVENTEVPAILETLAGKACSAEADTLPLDVETVPQSNLDQQLQLKAGQGDLPVLFSAGNAPALTKTLADSGNVADFEEILTDLDVIDNIEPAAISTIENLYGGFRVLPFEYNVEGIWYNKAIFAEQGIDEPQTFDELTAAAAKLEAAGIQPFSASGEQGWPITRLISGYLFRDLGPDALQKVADGEAKLTDPEYVAAAQAIADLGAEGYFGKGVGSIDMATSENQFLNGSAAMFYMGSWFLSQANDPEVNQIGAENVGFMPFPGVEGGAGDRSQLAANVGLPITMNAKAVNDDTEAWLSCITENYGSVALEQENRVSGFALNTEVTDVPPLTQLIQEQVADTETTVLWFEALFSAEATTTSQRNAAPLITGSVSAEEFMSMIQADLD
ncbi:MULTISPECIES: ABC transporter substrate-binding protein [unclassified Microbacterium]|uniref:ABC transporter substrate-binding protein n=1 Tax=unclassified Microbacterium TaxID=2609290 RepID=UPI001431F448|nr:MULTISPECIES: extracellular solute-binding protein [unclassified Microbacterium]NJI60261.1 extracellular solute-binding protein [Microbacterium sp. B19(2022)]